MILRIEVRENAGGWSAELTSPDHAAWQTVQRTGTIDAKGYPLPPAGESASWADPWLALCEPAGGTERQEAFDRFLEGDPRAGKRDVEALGGYLFWLMLGGSWPEAAGIQPDREPIRLQLVLPDAAIWWQLPWELMVDANSVPLGAYPRVVSVARLVTPNQATGKLEIEIPIKVLFVVGRELDNQLRPGAEYIALLRQLRCTIHAANESRGIALHARLLLETTTEALEAAVKDFRPTVVHVVSHGQILNQKSVLLLSKIDPQTRKPKQDPVDAARLAGLLQAADPNQRPHAVLLNACNTARIGDVQASFVAELVRMGIPLALGMAGAVADTASRLFATQFYTALTDEQPIDVAAAEGRRAALLHFGNFSQNFDWGRAVFCQAADVETKFTRLPLQQKLIDAAEKLRPKGPKREAFCGRYRWLAAIHDVCRRRVANLGIGSDEEAGPGEDDERGQLGKSRLLAEVAFQSVLEGWIPVHIPQQRERYLNLMHWAVNVFELLEKTRELFGVDRRQDSAIVKAGCAAWGVAAFTAGDLVSFTGARDSLVRALQPQQDIRAKIVADTILLMLREDFKQLRKDIEAAVGDRRGVLFLWDQLDDDEALNEDFIRLLGSDGLGTSAAPVPVIFTYATRSAGGKRLIRAINENSDVEVRRLAPFDAMESGLAVRQFVAWKKYVPNRKKLQDFEAAMSEFEETLAGYPSRLHQFEQGIKVIARTEVIEPFDGPTIIEGYR